MADSGGAAQIAKTLTHDNLIDLVRSFFPEMSDEGVCCGVTSMWLQAHVTGKQQEREFYHRLDGIAAYLHRPGKTVQSLKKEIMNWYEIRKKVPGIFLSDLEDLEIHAFCQMVALHQDPAKPSMILERKIAQGNKKHQYPLTASKALIAENKTIKYDIAGVVALNQQGLVKYLEELQKILEKENKKEHLASDKERAFLLGSDNHAVGLAFDFKIKKWRFFDVNLLAGRKEYYIEVESADLAPIMAASFFDSESQNTVFSIRCISTTHDKILVSAVKGKSHDLLEQSIGKENDRDVNVLDLAVSRGDIESVNMLLNLSSGFKANFKRELWMGGLDIRRKDGSKALFYASSRGYIKIVQSLLKAGVNVNARKRSDTHTALMAASEKGHTAVVKALVEAPGVEVNARLPSGWTALTLASENGHTKIVKALLEAPRIDVNVPGPNGWTALMLASKEGHTEVVKALLEEPGVEVNTLDSSGTTVALILASEKGHAGIVKALIEEGVGINVNVLGPNGKTALMIASEKGYTEVVKALLDSSSIGVNAWEPSGWTALMLASEKGHTEVVKALIEEGVGINVNLSGPSGKTALMLASEKGHTGVVNALLKAPGVDIKKNAWTALMLARDKGHAEVVKVLMAAAHGTPLMRASEKGHVKLVKALLKLDEGADVNSLNSSGKTALMLASEHGHTQVEKALLDAKAFLNTGAGDESQSGGQKPKR